MYIAWTDQKCDIQHQWSCADCGVSDGASAKHASVCAGVCGPVPQLERVGHTWTHAMDLLYWHHPSCRHTELLVSSSIKTGKGCGQK